jgi:hypothetical protein
LSRNIFYLANFGPNRSFGQGGESSKDDGDNHMAAMGHVTSLKKS